MSESSERPGRLSQALRRLLMKRATVVAVERFADRFHLITLAGVALESVSWFPGQKVQIAMGGGFATRTYTPMDWDVSAGRMRLLGYAHGDGPGSRWLQGLVLGDTCDVFGPRGSLDLRRLAGPLALLGDETAIGLGAAIVGLVGHENTTCHFEVTDPANSREALLRTGLGEATLYRRTTGDAHLVQMEAVIPELAASGASFVLAGKGASVQRFRQALKQCAVTATRIATKAYWVPGKAGLD